MLVWTGNVSTTPVSLAVLYCKEETALEVVNDTPTMVLLAFSRNDLTFCFIEVI